MTTKTEKISLEDLDRALAQLGTARVHESYVTETTRALFASISTALKASGVENSKELHGNIALALGRSRQETMVTEFVFGMRALSGRQSTMVILQDDEGDQIAVALVFGAGALMDRVKDAYENADLVWQDPLERQIDPIADGEE